jgi:NH3-dependent NAD+ synthetase
MQASERLALDNLTEWVESNTPENCGLILPVSGGSDSALAAYICGQAVGDRAVGVFFGESLRRQDWFSQQMEVMVTSLDANKLDPEAARWAHIVTQAVNEQRVIVGTRNKTEDVLGAYSTASKIAAMLPLLGVWKTDVIKLCHYVGVPTEITASSRQADADCGRPDELAALSLEQVDNFLKIKIGHLSSAAEIDIAPPEKAYLESFFLKNNFKKRLPYIGPEIVIN